MSVVINGKKQLHEKRFQGNYRINQYVKNLGKFYINEMTVSLRCYWYMQPISLW